MTAEEMREAAASLVHKWQETNWMQSRDARWTCDDIEAAIRALPLPEPPPDPPATMTEPAIWYLGAMNDATFIIDGPPYPAPDDTGPYLATGGPNPISGAIDDRNGKLIVAAHNAVVAEKDAELCRLKSQLWACENANAVLAKTDGLAQLVISEGATKDATIARLRSQLPSEMQDCTILFKECERGHGELTATNWVQHDCPWCTIARLSGELAAAREVLEWIAEPSLEMAHVVFRVEAQDRARAVLAKLSEKGTA